jgi:hypothetical protein
MSQQNKPPRVTTRSQSRAGIRPASTAPPENSDMMPGAMPQSTAPEATADMGVQHPQPLTAIPDTSINAIKGMTQTMEEQVDALFPEAQAVSQPSSINPFRVVSSALRSGLLSVQRDNNWEMNRIMQSIEHCEQHVHNQADYIRRIDAASKREGDASFIHARQFNSMVVSIADHGRGIQALSNSISDLLTQMRTTNTAIEEQSKQLVNLQAQVTSFQERVFSIPEQEEPQAEENEPSPAVEATQTQTPSFFRTRGQPQTSYHRTQMEESRASSRRSRTRKSGPVSVGDRPGNLLPVLLNTNQGNRTTQGEKEGSLHLHPLSTFLRKFG